MPRVCRHRRGIDALFAPLAGIASDCARRLRRRRFARAPCCGRPLAAGQRDGRRSIVLTVDHRPAGGLRRAWPQVVAAIARERGPARRASSPRTGAKPTADIEAAARAARYRLLLGGGPRSRRHASPHSPITATTRPRPSSCASSAAPASSASPPCAARSTLDGLVALPAVPRRAAGPPRRDDGGGRPDRRSTTR